MIENKLKVTLLDYTPNPDQVIAAAARLCYSNQDVDKIVETFSKDEVKTAEFVAKLIELHHDSPLEHVSFTFAIEGIDRSVSHQLVRHRIASYSQRSQRYVSEKEFEYITPPSIQANEEASEIFKATMNTINEAYNKLSDLGIPKEDARYVLPNACETKIIVTMNARSLFNFFNHRCCNRAQWAIRALAYQMLRLVQKVAPETFKNSGPYCVSHGYCPEGKMSCGRFSTLEQILDEYNNKN